MNAYLSGPTGPAWALPELLEWSITRTDGSSCDSFELSFSCTQDDCAVLRQATRFHAIDGSEVVFTGVVDEFELSLDDGGRTAQVSGRGLMAVLMDNQVRAAVYTSATARDILAAYVTPYGIKSVKNDLESSVSSFAVDSGDTCWQALAGFCRHAAARTPHFLADGTLDLTAPSTQTEWRLGADAAVAAAHYRVCRYGVISEQVMVDRSSGTQTSAKNEAFCAEGGQRRQVTAHAGRTVRATIRTAEQHLAESAQNWKCLRVTLPGCWLAEPGSLVAVELPVLGVQGRFRVAEVTTRMDASGLCCTLDMREE